MQIKFFTIPGTGCHLTEEDLNKFLRSHRILHVDKTFNPGSGGYWTLCIEYMDIESLADVPSYKKKDKDLTEELNDEEKQRFEKYRQIRLGLSRERNIKAFEIFSNNELALLSKLPAIDYSITEVEGVKPEHIKEYLPYFFTNNQEKNAAENQKPEGADTPF